MKSYLQPRVVNQCSHSLYFCNKLFMSFEPHFSSKKIKNTPLHDNTC